MSSQAGAVKNTCGNCGTESQADAQFCGGCGESLLQPCHKCNTSVLLSQKFCNSCGVDLQAEFEERFRRFEETLELVSELAAQGKYSSAVSRAEACRSVPDYRYKSIQERAKVLVSEVEQQQQHWAKELVRAEDRVVRYLDSNRYDDTVRVVEQIPEAIRTGDLNNALDEAKRRLFQIANCKQLLKEALASKDYAQATECLVELVEAFPKKEKYRLQLGQLVQKSIAKASKYKAAGQYAKALKLLESCPPDLKDEAYEKLIASCRSVLFLRRLVTEATFFTPTVKQAIDLLGKQLPDGKAVEKLNARAKGLLEQGAPAEDVLYHSWAKSKPGSLGVQVSPVRMPAAFARQLPKEHVRSSGLFWTAFGLAVQAMQYRMPTGDFMTVDGHKKKFGLLSGKAKPQSSGWGIDIGTSAIKIVQVVKGKDNEPEIAFAASFARSEKIGSESENQAATVVALKKAITASPIGSERICVGFPGNSLARRYVHLPPESDQAKLREYVVQEAKAHIPIGINELQVAYHMQADAGHEGTTAMLVAARKSEIDLRRSIVEAAGLKNVMIQPDPFALANAAEILAAGKDDGSELLIDSGHHQTNLLVRSKGKTWSRALAWGIVDLDRAVAMQLQVTLEKAAEMRRRALITDDFEQCLEAMQTTVLIPKREIERSINNAMEDIGEFELARAKVIGGGSFHPFLCCWLNGLPF